MSADPIAAYMERRRVALAAGLTELELISSDAVSTSSQLGARPSAPPTPAAAAAAPPPAFATPAPALQPVPSDTPTFSTVPGTLSQTPITASAFPAQSSSTGRKSKNIIYSRQDIDLLVREAPPTIRYQREYDDLWNDLAKRISGGRSGTELAKYWKSTSRNRVSWSPVPSKRSDPNLSTAANEEGANRS